MDVTVLARLEDRELVALLLEPLGRLEDRVMLERRDDEMRAAVGRELGEDADERGVVATRCRRR